MKKIFLLIMISSVTTSFTNITSKTSQDSFNINNSSPKLGNNLNKKQLLNKIVAIVNNKPITLIELEQEIYKLKSMETNPQFDQDTLAIKRQALQELIHQQVLLQSAKQNNINISNQQVNTAIKDIANKHKISVDSLKLNIEATGMSFNDYKKQIHNQLIIGQQQQVITQQIYVSPEETQEFMKKHTAEFDKQMNPIKTYTLRNLIMTIPNSNKSKNRKVLLYGKLAIAVNKGFIDFKELVEQFSEGANSSSGGLVNHPLEFKLIPKIYKNEIKKLKKRQVSKPFIVNNTLQMVYLDDIQINTPFLTKKITKYFMYGIVIKLKGNMDSNGAKKLLDKAKITIESGQKFTKIAERINQDYNHKNGHFGWVSILDNSPYLPIKTFACLQSLEIDKLSKPFQVDAKTWMIIKYTKTKIYDATKELKEQRAVNAIYSEKAQQLYKPWVTSMRNNTYIKVLQVNLKTPELY